MNHFTQTRCHLDETILSHLRQRFPHAAKARPKNSHKGNFGNVVICGGATGMSGAIVLAGRAALFSGAGKVYLSFLQSQLPVPWVSDLPELMLSICTNSWHLPASVRAVGCGMGQSTEAIAFMDQLIHQAQPCPLVLDADALNLIAAHPAWHDAIRHYPAAIIMTPHPLEAARLLGSHVTEIENNRRNSALTLAQTFNAHIVLKGQHSIIASANGNIDTNLHAGNPGLATAGSGDVLTGVIAALIAQGIPADEAASCGVWLHAAAADELVAQGIGPIGLNAGQLPQAIRCLRNALTSL